MLHRGNGAGIVQPDAGYAHSPHRGQHRQDQTPGNLSPNTLLFFFHLLFFPHLVVYVLIDHLKHLIGKKRVKLAAFSLFDLPPDKTHPAIGAEILENISELPELAYGARWHHERYDGRGYPDGLQGDEIPISAQVSTISPLCRSFS